MIQAGPIPIAIRFPAETPVKYPSHLTSILAIVTGLGAFGAPVSAAAMHEFPTLARVEYVEQCINEFDRPRQELIYKCSCAIDVIATEVDHDTWVGLETFNNAAPIAGERGGYIRERKDLRTQVKSYRDLQSKARKACFLPETTRQ